MYDGTGSGVSAAIYLLIDVLDVLDNIHIYCTIMSLVTKSVIDLTFDFTQSES